MNTINTSKTTSKNTVTMSFSLDHETKRMIEDMAKRSGKSKSDVVRDNVRYYQWQKQWRRLQEDLKPFAEKHNIQSEEDVYKFFAD